MDISTTFLVVGLCIAFVVLAIVAMVFLRNRLLNKAVVTAIIDIFTTGNYHIEYLPVDYSNPIDLIQLSTSYVAKMDYVTNGNPEHTRKSQSYLYFTLASYDDYPDNFDAKKYRQHLTTLEQMVSLQPSLLDDNTKAVGNSDRFIAGLIHGGKSDYVATKFSVACYKPNIYNSAVYLFCDTAKRLNDSDLLIHCRAIAWYMSLRDDLQLGIVQGKTKDLTGVQQVNLAYSAVRMAVEENKVMEGNIYGL